MTRGVVVERKAVTAEELAGIDVCRRLEPALRAAIAAQAVRLRVPRGKPSSWPRATPAATSTSCSPGACV